MWPDSIEWHSTRTCDWSSVKRTWVCFNLVIQKPDVSAHSEIPYSDCIHRPSSDDRPWASLTCCVALSLNIITYLCVELHSKHNSTPNVADAHVGFLVLQSLQTLFCCFCVIVAKIVCSSAVGTYLFSILILIVLGWCLNVLWFCLCCTV